MAPSPAKLKEALLQGTRDVFEAEPDETSVNKVRRYVEEKLGLEEGFFTGEKWKQTSKDIIKEQVERLLDAAEEGSEAEAEPKAGVKRVSPKTESPQPKRRKGASGALKKEQEANGAGEEEMEAGGEAEEEPEEPETKPKTAKTGPRRRSKVAEPDAQAGEEKVKPKGKKIAARRMKPKAKAVADSDEDLEDELGVKDCSRDDIVDDELEEHSGVDSQDELEQGADDEKPKAGRAANKAVNGAEKRRAKQQAQEEDDREAEAEEEAEPKAESEPEPEANEEEEYSDVIDEPAPPKSRKKAAGSTSKEPSTTSSSKRKAPASSSAPKKPRTKPSTAAADDPHEAEIKKLQSQLAKCGIRKLWHIELKQYSGDARAKIRHLRTMLAEVGMDGRFSEAKAREIREMRELRADVEAAQEMNKLWGMTSGRRAARGKSKSQSVQMDVDDDEEEGGGGGDEGRGGGEGLGRGGDDGGEGEEEDGETSFAARRRRAHADLAFLGDDSDSE